MPLDAELPDYGMSAPNHHTIACVRWLELCDTFLRRQQGAELRERGMFPALHLHA